MYSVELFVLLHGLRATLLRRSLTVHRTDSTDANGTRPSFCRSSSRTDFRSRRKTWKTETERIVIKIYCHRSLYDSFVRHSNALGLVGLLHVCSKWAESSVSGVKRTNGKPRIGKFEFVGLWLQKSSHNGREKGNAKRSVCDEKLNSILRLVREEPRAWTVSLVQHIIHPLKLTYKFCFDNGGSPLQITEMRYWSMEHGSRSCKNIITNTASSNAENEIYTTEERSERWRRRRYREKKLNPFWLNGALSTSWWWWR